MRDALARAGVGAVLGRVSSGRIDVVEGSRERSFGPPDAELTATVQINDPAALAGGLKVSGTPSPNHVLVADSAPTATWKSLQGSNPGPVVSVIKSSRSYSIPRGASHLRITCVGGGGGGGGGGSASSAIAQAGGSGARPTLHPPS